MIQHQTENRQAKVQILLTYSIGAIAAIAFRRAGPSAYQNRHASWPTQRGSRASLGQPLTSQRNRGNITRSSFCFTGETLLFIHTKAIPQHSKQSR